MAWNPTKAPITKVHPVEASRDGKGKARASVTFRSWRGRERLAYEDVSILRMIRTDADGEDTMLLGRLRTFAAALTIVDSTGFPDAGGRVGVPVG